VQGNVNVLNTVIMGSSFLRNRLINGGMQISQRQATGSGATITSAGAGVFGPDRWWTLASVSSVATVFQVATGASDFPYAMRVQRGNGQASTPTMYAGQTIESYNCVDLSNQTVTLSFYATAGANYSGGSASVQLWTGTGTDQGTLSLNNATWTGQTQILYAAFTPTTTRTRFSFTVPVGASIGEMAVRWSWVTTGTAGAADYIDFTGCQLEPGPVATPFERRLYGQELSLCQRYYQTYSQPPLRGVAGSTTGASRMGMVLPVVMRATPNYTVGALPIFDGAAVTTVSSVLASYVTASVAEFDFNLAGAITQYRPIIVYQSGTSTMTLSAEL
jgi:hypothetical protein